MMVLGGGLLAALAYGQPTPMGALFGTCPTPSADPLSVCYDAGAAQAQHAQDAWTIEQLEAGHDCTPTGRPGQIPTSVVLATGGKIVRLPFAVAWRLVHQPAPTRVYGICAK